MTHGSRQPTVEEAIDIVIRHAMTPSDAGKNIEFWRQKFGDEFANEVRDKARVEWKKKRK